METGATDETLWQEPESDPSKMADLSPKTFPNISNDTNTNQALADLKQGKEAEFTEEKRQSISTEESKQRKI